MSDSGPLHQVANIKVGDDIESLLKQQQKDDDYRGAGWAPNPRLSFANSRRSFYPGNAALTSQGTLQFRDVRIQI